MEMDGAQNVCGLKPEQAAGRGPERRRKLAYSALNNTLIA